MWEPLDNVHSCSAEAERMTYTPALLEAAAAVETSGSVDQTHQCAVWTEDTRQGPSFCAWTAPGQPTSPPSCLGHRQQPCLRAGPGVLFSLSWNIPPALR